MSSSMTQEDLVISKHSCNLVKEKSDLIFGLWSTQITFESITDCVGEDIIEINDAHTDQWLTLSAKEKQELDKAKEFIKALCNPELAEVTEIDSKLKTKLNDHFLRHLIEQYQVHIDLLTDVNVLVQGKKENVMKCLIDIKCKPFSVGSNFEETFVNPASSLSDDNEDNEDEIKWIENMKNLTPKSYNKLASKVENKNKNQKDNNKNQNAQASNFIQEDDSEKRYIVIDGSNVAVEHAKATSKGKCFSCRGIKLACEYFIKRGHKNVHAFVPRFRRGTSDHKYPSLEPEILDELENNGLLVYTPSRYDKFKNKFYFSYDDKFILYAAEHYDAVIVSNDQYRDLQQEKKEWQELVSKNLLQYSFMGDLFMVADDPFGRSGPPIDEFLSKKSSSSKSNGVNKSKSSSSDLNQKKSKKINGNHNNLNGKKKDKIQSASTSAAAVVSDSEEENNVEKEETEAIRDEEKSGELFINLVEMFPESGDRISELLQMHSTKSDVNFFVQRLLDKN